MVDRSMSDWFPTFSRIANRPIAVPLAFPFYTTAVQRRMLLRLIAVGIEDRLPLAPIVEALAHDERGPQKYRLQRLARLLAGGTPLADAVEAVPGVLRDEDILAIRFDAQSGTVTNAVRESLRNSTRSPFGKRRSPFNTLIYFCAVVLMMFPVVTFTQTQIVPNLNQICAEFDINPPWTLQWTQWLNVAIVNLWWVGVLILVALLWSAFSAWPGRFLRRSLLGRFFLPLRELHAADVLQKISIATKVGRPIPGALSTLARYHFDPMIRNKLLFVRNEVEQGADVWQTMNAVDMLTQPEVRAIAAAQRIGNRPWTLEQLASGKRQCIRSRLERISDLLLPLVAIIMGTFVLLQGMSTFLLLSHLVRGLA